MDNKKELLIERLFDETYFSDECECSVEDMKEMKAMSIEEKEECLIQYYQAAGFSINNIEDLIKKQ